MGHSSTAAGMVLTTTHGPAWHGDAVMDTLKSVSAAHAAARPIAKAHTIWEILNHLTAWQEFAVRAFQGGDARELEGEDDWPPARETSPEAWVAAVDRFEDSGRRLADLIKDCDEDRIKSTVNGRDYSLKFLAYGVPDHNIYHQGQIALIKKALS